MKYTRRKDPLYHIWKSMRGRCMCQTNSRYKDYGGKGISICQEWNDFNVFKKWSLNNGFQYLGTKNSGESLSLDRINVNGGYYPENCRWISKTENSKLRTAAIDKINIQLEDCNYILEIYRGNDYE